MISVAGAGHAAAAGTGGGGEAGAHPAAAAAGATPRVELPQNQLFAVFGRRCSFTKQHGQRALLEATNSMQFGITTAAWSRVLTALRDSGLLAASFNSKRSLARAIKTLTIANAADLVIEDADLDLGEPFDTPAVAAVPARAAAGRPAAARAGRGRGRADRGGVPPPAAAAVAAIPAVPGPVELEFLALASVTRLEECGEEEPCRVLAFLLGLLGGCATRASRIPQLAMVQTSAALLESNLLVFTGSSPAATAAFKAVHLHKFLAAALNSMPEALRTDSIDDDDLADFIVCKPGRDYRQVFGLT